MSTHKSGAITLAFANERDGPKVESQPRLEVRSWRLLRSPSGTLHLLTLTGLSEEGCSVRVTSPIMAIDPAAGIVTTSSGRQYVLLSPFEDREIERDLLHRGAVRLGMGDSVDVSVFAWDQVHIG